MLEPLGLGTTGEEVYRALLGEPDSSARELAERTGLPLARVREDLAHLVSLRLAQRNEGRPARFRTAPPDIAITAVVNERQAGLDRARLAVPELLAEYHEGTAPPPRTLMEVLTGPRVGYRRFLELLAATSEELLTFDRMSGGEKFGAVEVEAEAPMLARGVACRAVYEQGAVEAPGRLPHLRRLADLGEQARVAQRLPLKMLICDRKRAMLPLTGAGGNTSESVVLIGPSALLDGLVEIFEAYWQRSPPLWSTIRREVGATGLSEDEYEVLQLLATGVKDEAIARQLGISMRTARRRISSLIATLGVGSRFQAGVEAARRGLL